MNENLYKELSYLRQVAEVRTCQYCHKQFGAVKERERIYCSPLCRQKMHQQRKK